MSIERVKWLLEKCILPGIDGKLKGPIGNPIKILREESLEQFVEVNGGNTLLKILGYRPQDVDVKPFSRALGTNTIIPDYALLPQKKDIDQIEYSAIVDLKAPKENLDLHVKQILSYCHEANAPFGLLFNGHSVRLFINTKMDGLAKHEDFKEQAVAGADRNDVQRMAEILFIISKQSLKENAISQARGLAITQRKKINDDIDDKQRQQAIRNRLNKIKDKPSEAVLSAIKSADKILAELKPTISEIRVNWQPEAEQPLTPGKKAALTKKMNKLVGK